MQMIPINHHLTLLKYQLQQCYDLEQHTEQHSVQHNEHNKTALLIQYFTVFERKHIAKLSLA